MSNVIPVTNADLRNALALAKAKIEGEASANRAACNRADAREFMERAESCDRMASSIGALLAAPPAKESVVSTGFIAIGLYRDGDRWAGDTYESAEAAEQNAPNYLDVAAVIQVDKLADGREIFKGVVA